MAHFISLGTRCQIAGQLRRLQLRDGLYPLDWMICDTFWSLEELIRRDFAGFFAPDNVRCQLWGGHVYVEDTHYWINTPHYFQSAGCPDATPDDLPRLAPIFAAKLARAAVRFRAALSSGQRTYLFRRGIQPWEATTLVALLAEKYPDADFKLVCLPPLDAPLDPWEHLTDNRLWIAPLSDPEAAGQDHSRFDHEWDHLLDLLRAEAALAPPSSTQPSAL